MTSKKIKLENKFNNTTPSRKSSKPRQSASEILKNLGIQCNICREVPPKNVLQCQNGHLICSDCFEKICAKPFVKCAICSVRMDRNSPSRNTLAEKMISETPVDCSFSSCKASLPPIEIKRHENICPFKPAVCIFGGFGCSWSGLKRDKKEHERHCSVSSKKLKDLKRSQKGTLSLTSKLSAQSLQGTVFSLLNSGQLMKVKNAFKIEKNGEELANFLSSQARNMDIREICPRRMGDNGNFSSTKFCCLGESFRLHLKVYSQGVNAENYSVENPNSATLDVLVNAFNTITDTAEGVVETNPGTNSTSNINSNTVIISEKEKEKEKLKEGDKEKLFLEFGLEMIPRARSDPGNLFYQFVILKGPESFYEFLEPIYGKFCFNRSKGGIKWVKKSFELSSEESLYGPKEIAKEMSGSNSLVWRIILMNKADGVSRSFRNSSEDSEVEGEFSGETEEEGSSGLDGSGESIIDAEDVTEIEVERTT